MLENTAFMGSPSVSSERISSGEHLRTAGTELAKYCGIATFAATLWCVCFESGIVANAVVDCSDEIGGSNGMQSLQMARYYGIPALDVDLMGRGSFPFSLDTSLVLMVALLLSSVSYAESTFAWYVTFELWRGEICLT